MPMTPEELARHFDRTSEAALDLSMAVISRVWEEASALVRAHLCTPNPLHAAAPDMLALLLDIDRSTYFPRETGLQERLEVVIAKAKGTSDV